MDRSESCLQLPEIVPDPGARRRTPLPPLFARLARRRSRVPHWSSFVFWVRAAAHHAFHQPLRRFPPRGGFPPPLLRTARSHACIIRAHPPPRCCCCRCCGAASSSSSTTAEKDARQFTGNLVVPNYRSRRALVVDPSVRPSSSSSSSSSYPPCVSSSTSVAPSLTGDEEEGEERDATWVPAAPRS